MIVTHQYNLFVLAYGIIYFLTITKMLKDLVVLKLFFLSKGKNHCTLSILYTKKKYFFKHEFIQITK